MKTSAEAKSDHYQDKFIRERLDREAFQEYSERLEDRLFWWKIATFVLLLGIGVLLFG